MHHHTTAHIRTTMFAMLAVVPAHPLNIEDALQHHRPSSERRGLNGRCCDVSNSPREGRLGMGGLSRTIARLTDDPC